MFAILAAMWAAGEVRERYAQPDLADLDAVMASFAEDAVAMAAQRHGIRLDYGPESMEQVEEILAPLHETHKEGNLSRDEIAGEVVKRLKEGNWEKEDSPGGGGSLSVVWDGTAFFPCRWCGKRILDGPDDNIWAKFRFLILDEAGIDSQPANWPSIEPSPDAGR